MIRTTIFDDEDRYDTSYGSKLVDKMISSPLIKTFQTKKYDTGYDKGYGTSMIDNLLNKSKAYEPKKYDFGYKPIESNLGSKLIDKMLSNPSIKTFQTKKYDFGYKPYEPRYDAKLGPSPIAPPTYSMILPKPPKPKLTPCYYWSDTGTIGTSVTKLIMPSLPKINVPPPHKNVDIGTHSVFTSEPKNHWW